MDSNVFYSLQLTSSAVDFAQLAGLYQYVPGRYLGLQRATGAERRITLSATRAAGGGRVIVPATQRVSLAPRRAAGENATYA